MKVDDPDRKSPKRPSQDRPYASRARRRRKGRAAFIVALLVFGAAIGASLYYFSIPEPAMQDLAASAPADKSPKPVERTAALPPLNLPADDAAHGSTMEWWYYNGILDDKAMHRYAFHMVVFVGNGLIKHTVMHAALTDLQTGKRYTSQTRTAGVPAQGATDGFDFRDQGWQVTASGASQMLSATLDGASLALDLGESGPTVAHRAPGSETPGLLDFGASGISYYYSRPRLPAKGEIAVAGKPVRVSGDVWFDHQWGEFDVLTLGWNWFALHLADGTDLMVYELFDMDGHSVVTAGTLSNAKDAVPLKAGEVTLERRNTWTSPKTHISYPVEWDVRLPSGVMNVKPFVADSEFDSGTTTGNVYWEGPVKVSGSREGQGFLELSGYDRLGAAQARSK
jgi:predicted secreted hydrolase